MMNWDKLIGEMRLDYAQRGLLSVESQCLNREPFNFKATAESLAHNATKVGIVTGFAIRSRFGVRPETDGPLGTLYLAKILQELGKSIFLVTDAIALRTLEAGLERMRLHDIPIKCLPLDPAGCKTLGQTESKREDCKNYIARDDWVQDFFDSQLVRGLSHLIFIERAGPSHNLDSLAMQSRNTPVPLERFTNAVPIAARDVVHNMRGESIDSHTARSHLLVEFIGNNLTHVVTVGIADGGNEIGMGNIPWELLANALGDTLGGRIACRVATNHTILSATSNWGAYALAGAVANCLGSSHVLQGWTVDNHSDLLTCLVRAGAVDGVTKQLNSTVDGISTQDYLRQFAAIIACCL